MLTETQCLIAGYNLLLERQLGEVLRAFNNAGIPVILLKGLSLVESVYPHLGARSMADIDLLVRKDHRIRACKALEELGFQQKLGNSGYCFVKEDAILCAVDVHAGVAYSCDDEIWAEVEEASFGGLTVTTLSKEQTIIYLCYHLGICHGYPYARWLEDIHRFIAHHQAVIDWQLLLAKIDTYRLRIPVYLSLTKTKARFKTPIPDSFLLQCKPGLSPRAKIFELIFKSPSLIPFTSYISMALLQQPRYLLSRFFPPLDFLKMRYQTNSAGACCCYFIHPFSLCLSGARGVCALFMSRFHHH